MKLLSKPPVQTPTIKKKTFFHSPYVVLKQPGVIYPSHTAYIVVSQFSKVTVYCVYDPACFCTINLEPSLGTPVLYKRKRPYMKAQLGLQHCQGVERISPPRHYFYGLCPLKPCVVLDSSGWRYGRISCILMQQLSETVSDCVSQVAQVVPLLCRDTSDP